jgi:hypothetical protein
MTCWTSFSSRRAARALALALAVAGGVGCAGVQRSEPAAAARPYRLALFPTQNLSPSPVPVRGVEREIVRSIASAGLEVVMGDAVERFLERHRVRFTGGIDGPTASAAHDELGVDGILISSVELYSDEGEPRIGVTMRVVAATEQANLVWIGGTSRTGFDSPGLLNLGLVPRFVDLERRELNRLSESLVRTVIGKAGTASLCPGGRRFRPRVAFRSPRFDPSRSYSVAVLPFVNDSARRGAGDLLALEFTRQLAAVPRLHVVEPGVVRDRLIRNRVVMEGGVSVDTARLMLDALNADLVFAGYVRELNEGDRTTVDFTVLALEREHGRIVWESTSHATGTDGVWLFDIGKISTASELACRTVRDTVVELVGDPGR